MIFKRLSQQYLGLVLTTLLLAACGAATQSDSAEPNPSKATLDTNASLVVAGGCFWCVESDFEKLATVGDVISGYAGGTSDAPTYRNHADHLEVVQIPYDANAVTYRELIDYFLRHIDPLDEGGQFCDRGHSYTTALFYRSEDEKQQAEAAIAAAEAELGTGVATRILALDQFWIAEDYHQDYYLKNPLQYKFYRSGCGRDQRVAEVWGQTHE